jgi:hypothetical protein
VSTFEAQSVAILTRFTAGWVPATWTPAVDWYGDNTTAPADRAFLRFVVRPATASLETVGQIGSALSPVVHRYLGVAIAQCMTPVGGGGEQALEMADAVLAIFSGASDPGITYHGPTGQAPWIDVIGETSDRLWWQVNAFIPFYRDTSR